MQGPCHGVDAPSLSQSIVPVKTKKVIPLAVLGNSTEYSIEPGRTLIKCMGCKSSYI